MKHSHILIGSIVIAASSLVAIASSLPVTKKSDTKHYTFQVSGGHGYVETSDGKPGTGISIPEENRVDGRPEKVKKLTNWTNADACAVYYFHHPADSVATAMRITATNGKTVKLHLTVTDPDSPDTPLADKDFTVNGNGKEQTIDICKVKYPKSKYYRYRFQCLEGNKNINNIAGFIFTSNANEESYVANYRSSPSVHLSNWRSNNAPSGSVYDWCYQEVMIPEESDIVGTYCMSLGVLDGYMGIQMNGYTNGEPEHNVIFSMWDKGSTDVDPNLPEYLRAGAVDAGDGVTITRFNNEGTGAKTFKSGNQWKAGTFVQFLTNCRPEHTSYTTVENGKTVEHPQTNTLVSTWYNAQDGKGWQYMATIRLRNNTTYFKSWYSFLENYNTTTGQMNRLAYYRNGYARKYDTKRWYNFNIVSFGHTDGGSNIGARSDYGQGATATASDRTFYMQTGGYTSTTQGKTYVPATNKTNPVDTIDLDKLYERVEEAVAKEKKKAEEDELFQNSMLDKTGWKVISFSSEETSGEGSNGRAQQTVDGDYNTYWHSRWTGSTAQLPHTIVVDMQKTNKVGGFKITMSGGNRRYIKAFDLYGSTDNKNWVKMYSDEDAPEEVAFRAYLDQPYEIRYFKIVVRATRANDGPFVRINEIDLASDAVIATSVKRIQTSDADINVSGRTLTVDVPEGSSHSLAVAVYGLSGNLVAKSNGSKTISLSALPAGTYLVRATWSSGSIARKIVVE